VKERKGSSQKLVKSVSPVIAANNTLAFHWSSYPYNIARTI